MEPSNIQIVGNPVHVTERYEFKRCRRKWDYHYNQLLVQKDRNKGALWFGIGIHAVLAHYYRQIMNNGAELTAKDLVNLFYQYCNDTPVLLPTEESQEWRAESIMLAVSMLNIYIEETRQREIDEGWRILAVEMPLEFNGLTGTIDMLVETKDGLFIVDHKGLATFATTEQLELDDQMTAYIWAAHKCGIKVDGAIYNMIRKKVPAEPKVLVKGGLSKAQNIDTTYTKYMRAITDNGLDPADYIDVLANIKMNQFVRREKVHRSSFNLTMFERTLPFELVDMKLVGNYLYPNITKDCSFDCSYRTLCMCEQDMGDVELLKELYYDKMPSARTEYTFDKE